VSCRRWPACSPSRAAACGGEPGRAVRPRRPARATIFRVPESVSGPSGDALATTSPGCSSRQSLMSRALSHLRARDLTATTTGCGTHRSATLWAGAFGSGTNTVDARHPPPAQSGAMVGIGEHYAPFWRQGSCHSMGKTFHISPPYLLTDLRTDIKYCRRSADLPLRMGGSSSATR
jgi:hypothetical protein